MKTIAELETPITLFDQYGEPKPVPEQLITPLTYQEIASWSHRERIDYVRDFVTTSFGPLVSEQLTLISDSQEVIHSPSDSELLLGAYAQSYDLFAQEQDLFTQAQTAAEAQYKAELTEIRKNQLLKNHKKREQERACIQKWTGATLPQFEQEISAIATIHNSLADLLILDFFTQDGGVEVLETALSEWQGHNPQLHQQLVTLLEAGKKRIITERGRSQDLDVQLIDYKEGDRELHKITPQSTLPQLVRCAFTEETNPLLRTSALELLKLYWQRIDTISGPEEQTPYLTLIYDLLYSAFIHDQPEILELISDWISSSVGKTKNIDPVTKKNISGSTILEREKEIVLSLALKEVIITDRQLSQLLPLHALASSDDVINYLLSKSTAEIQKYADLLITGKHHNLLGGLNLLKGFYIMNNRPQFAQLIATTIPADYLKDKEAKRLKTIADRVVSFQHVTHNPNQPELWQMGHYYIQNRGSISDANTANNSLHDLYSLIRFAHPDNQYAQDAINSHIINAVFTDRDKRVPKETIQNNQELLSLCTSRYDYFVALCGDQFNSDDNPQLDAIGIQSITFYPMFGKSGFYRVHLVTHNTDLNGQLLSANFCLGPKSQLLSLDNLAPLPSTSYHVTEYFKSAALPLLHFIVSGEAFDKKKAPIGKNSELTDIEREVLSRRPHWRELPPEYTLRSLGALQHAQHVKQYYGYDIFTENTRRHLAGTLQQDHYITYVKGFIKDGAQPNTFVYPQEIIT